ncbi:MAG: nitrate reductase [Rhodobacterales bacterium]|nr:MAG: nitrate reductase [Rhodobacterales bacterium]
MAEKPVIMPDGHRFYAQKYEVTIAEWNACHDAGACALHIRTRPDMQSETTPATGVSYLDAGEFLAWINANSGHTFRLPTVAEWEFMAQEVAHEPDPIFTDPSLSWASSYMLENLPSRALKKTGSFDMTSGGIGDLPGSVWEWTQDCYAGSEEGREIPDDRCPAFFAAGEHMAALSILVRDPARGGCAVGSPPAHLGLRLVSDTPVPVRP